MTTIDDRIAKQKAILETIVRLSTHAHYAGTQLGFSLTRMSDEEVSQLDTLLRAVETRMRRDYMRRIELRKEGKP